MAEGRGGSRPGSGRKSKREKYARLYAATEKDMHAILPEVAPALRELVVGVWEERMTPDGEMRVYQSQPNVKAIELLLNRTMGAVQKPEDGPRDGNVFIFQIAPPQQTGVVIEGTAREVPQLG